MSNFNNLNHPHPIIPKRTPNKVRIYYLLCEGWDRKRISTHLKVSVSLVRKYTTRYEREKRIRKTNNKPAIYTKATTITDSSAPHHSSSNITHPKPLSLPANFQGSFSMEGKTPLRKDARGLTFIKKASHTIRFAKVKATIWLHSFRGSNPQEIMRNGRKDILDLGRLYEQKYGIMLSLLRFYDGLEWIVCSEETSKRMGKSAGIKKGERKEVAGAIHINRDKSHPWNFQINPLNGGEQKRPTQHADIHHYIYSGKIVKDMITVHETIKEQSEVNKDLSRNIKLHLEIMNEIKDALKELRQTLRKP